jgi:hypothetical protein
MPLLIQVVTETNLLAKSEEFEKAIGQGDRLSLVMYCDEKVIGATVEEEQETWAFLKVLFDDDARRCAHGFPPPFRTPFLHPMTGYALSNWHQRKHNYAA